MRDHDKILSPFRCWLMALPVRLLQLSLVFATLLSAFSRPSFTATDSGAGKEEPSHARPGPKFLQQRHKVDAPAVPAPRRRQQGDDSSTSPRITTTSAPVLAAAAAPCRRANEDSGQAGTGLPLLISLPIIVVLVMVSGLFSGLMMGLRGLDIISLQIMQNGRNEEMAKCAEKIIPVRDKGNQLLCTLLLGNVAVNSALAILTAEIASGLVVGFLVSTAMIVIFGELLPQAACSRYALQVGSRTVPIVKCLMIAFYILTKPMSIVLDRWLGREVGTICSRTELMETLKIQIRLGAVDETEGEIAKQVAEGAISFRDKVVKDVMTPLGKAYMLSHETRLGYETIREIFETGFSRIPVFGNDKNDYRGLLYTKDLMIVDPEDEMKLGDFISIFHRKVESFCQEDKLVTVLNAFKKGGTHMGLVREVDISVDVDPHFEIRGVLTLEDVMEQILQDEIVDETDVYVDNERNVLNTLASQNFQLEVFNPVWKKHRQRLIHEEASAIATHLGRSLFCKGSGMELSRRALEWLVSNSTVEDRHRASTLGAEEHLEIDEIYRYGRETSICTLILQGRLTIRAGHDSFRTEAGAFTILAREALRAGKRFAPDFTAFLGTQTVRFLSISKANYLEARDLDQHKSVLEHSIRLFAAETVGETLRRESKKTTREKKDLPSTIIRL